MNTEAVEQEVRSFEDRRYRAMLEGDATALEQLLGDGLVYTHSTGTTDSKQTYIDGVKANKLSYRNIERLQERVQIYDKTAVVSGQARIDVLIAGVPRVANLRYLSILVHTTNRWQLIAFQATPISG